MGDGLAPPFPLPCLCLAHLPGLAPYNLTGLLLVALASSPRQHAAYCSLAGPTLPNQAVADCRDCSPFPVCGSVVDRQPRFLFFRVLSGNRSFCQLCVSPGRGTPTSRSAPDRWSVAVRRVPDLSSRGLALRCGTPARAGAAHVLAFLYASVAVVASGKNARAIHSHCIVCPPGGTCIMHLMTPNDTRTRVSSAELNVLTQ